MMGLQIPHMLIAAGSFLVLVGFVGLIVRRKRT